MPRITRYYFSWPKYQLEEYFKRFPSTKPIEEYGALLARKPDSVYGK